MFDNKYLPPEKLQARIEQLKQQAGSCRFEQQAIGRSVNGRPIQSYQIGHGPTKVLIWSQMHGNESISSWGLLAGLEQILESERWLLDKLQLNVIFQLNPDGAQLHARTNANGVDLNRDAKELSQPESRSLQSVFESFGPSFCFNLHDQRTIYAVGDGGPPTKLAVSTALADTSNPGRASQQAMQFLAAVRSDLEADHPQAVARFVDDYNTNCFTDSFIDQGAPAILLESGYYPGDYLRRQTAGLIAGWLSLALTRLAKDDYADCPAGQYLQIPANTPQFVDLAVKNLNFRPSNQLAFEQLAFAIKDKLVDGRVEFILHATEEHLNWGSFRAHYEIDLAES